MNIQFKERNVLLTPKEQILVNRGINKKEINHYMNTTDADINSWRAFGEENMKCAVRRVMDAMNQDEKVLVIVDSDADGYTSSALLLNYLHRVRTSWVEGSVEYFIHSGKQHGLSDIDIAEVADKYSLVITPDGSSEDYEYHLQFAEQGVDILVLDHHEAKIQSPNAIVINNQLCSYPNKQLSGAGVTWQFCRAMDEHLGVHYADDYLDLVALGDCADMMSMLSVETKHLITKGFKEENLHNPFIRGLRQKNSYSIGDKLTPHGAAWYIAPFINAIVRSGTEEEKDIVFQSMLNHRAYKEIPSTKRGHKPGEMETILVQALRVVTNVKSRQTNAQDAAMEILEEKIARENLLNHKVLLILLEKDTISPNLAGLVANKLASKYQRPCCILTRKEKVISAYSPDGREAIKTIIAVYEGSARGYEKFGLADFRQLCIGSGAIDYAQGHGNAFGLGILVKDIPDFVERTDKALMGQPNEPQYFADFDGNWVDFDTIYQCTLFDDCVGKDFEEPLIGFSHLRVTPSMVTVYRKKNLTIKILLPNNISLMIFQASEEMCELLQDDQGVHYLDAIGTANLNEFNGNVTGQIIAKDYGISYRSYDF